MTTQEPGTETLRPVRERIEEALDTIRPALHIDGGDAEFVEYREDDGVLRLRFVGACNACPISSMTLKHGIERRVRAMVPEVSAVQAV